MTSTSGICAAVMLSLLMPCNGETRLSPETNAVGADVLWGQIEQAVDEHEKRTSDKSPSVVDMYRLRELALQFYERYSDDPRTTFLRRAFLTNHPDPFEPFLRAVVREHDRKKRTRDPAWDRDAGARELLAMAASNTNGSAIVGRFHWLQMVTRKAHLGMDTELDMYAELKASSNEALRELIAGRERFLALRKRPLDLALSTSNGEILDLKQLHGKVVLLDIWSVECGSCINAMPRIQVLYEKYRSRDFQVVGLLMVPYDEPGKQLAAKRRAVDIIRKQGANWPETELVGKEVVSAFESAYGFSGGPQLWLLDQTGRVVLDVDLDDLHGPRAGRSRLELEIERLLAFRERPPSMTFVR